MDIKGKTPFKNLVSPSTKKETKSSNLIYAKQNTLANLKIGLKNSADQVLIDSRTPHGKLTRAKEIL